MYSGIGNPARWVLPEVLVEQAGLRPNASWIEMIDGDRLSFGQALADVRQVAGHLAELGVKPGDMVAVMMPNSIEFVRVWLGIGTLGAVAVLLNTELRGAFLQHQLHNCGASLAIADQSSAGLICEVAAPVTTLCRVAIASSGPETLGGTGSSDSVGGTCTGAKLHRVLFANCKS